MQTENGFKRVSETALGRWVWHPVRRAEEGSRLKLLGDVWVSPRGSQRYSLFWELDLTVP